jgi:7 transmembrane sweet-taste receptor of 3 GCPR
MLVSLNVVVLLAWHWLSPMRWTRTPGNDTDSFNRVLESSAVCASDNSLEFAAAIIILNLGFLITGAVWAFRSRNLETDYKESKYISLAISAVLQAWLMGLPVIGVVRQNPSSSFLVKCGLILVTSALVVGLVFIPKMWEMRQAYLTETNPRARYRHWKRRIYEAESIVPDNDPRSSQPTGPTARSPFKLPHSSRKQATTSSTEGSRQTPVDGPENEVRSRCLWWMFSIKIPLVLKLLLALPMTEIRR